MSFIASLGNWLRKISQSFAHASINGQNIILTKHNGDTVVLDVLSQAGFVAKSGDTLTGPLDFRNAQADYTGNPVDQIRGTMGWSDCWRIAIGANASDAGYLEIATADNGNEPVYVSQYTRSQDSAFATLKRRATLLDASGNTDFPGSVSASSFIGALTGNVTGDVTGNVSGGAGWLKTTDINYKNIDTDYSNTYVIGLSNDNHGTRPNGTWTNLISIDSYHFQSQLAVTNIETGTHVPKFFVRSKYYTGSWSDWVHLADDTEATASAKGLMSAADKSKLDSIDSTYLPLSGGTLTGALVLNGSNVVIRQKGTTAESRLCGGTDLTDGAVFIAYGKDNGGGFRVRAVGNHDLVGSANGELTWKSLLLSPIKYASFTNNQAIIEYENKFQVVASGGTAANGGTINFARAFSKIPIVICQHPGTVLVHAQAHTVTTTGFTVAHSYSSAVAIRYIAIGEGV